MLCKNRLCFEAKHRKTVTKFCRQGDLLSEFGSETDTRRSRLDADAEIVDLLLTFLGG